MENYSKGKLLGKGSFGSAWLCTSKLDAKNYVIKEVDISRMPRAEREAAEQEAKLLLALKHPNIVRCKECFTSGSKLCIVMDWCSEGDLYSILQQRKGQLLPEETVLDWFVQICLGLKHVHDRKILHRDLKSQNIFVSAGGLLKLGDFGVSKVLSSTVALATTAVGTPYYLSPEICQNRKYNQKSDMWSLGCVLYEMATMRQAFEAPNMRALITKIIRGAYNPLLPSRSPELRGLIASLLVLDARKRPSINEVLALPVLRARIARLLDQTLQVHEFSHTIIHGRPQPGQLVVALQPGSNSSPAAGPQDKQDERPGAAAAGAAAAGGGGGRIRLSAPPAVGLPVRLSAVPPKPAVPKLSGPALRQQPAVAAPTAKINLRLPSREQLLQGAPAVGLPAKSPSRAPGPSAAAAAAAARQPPPRSPLPSPKLSPRGDGMGVAAGVKLPSPRGERPPAAAAAGVKLPSPGGEQGVKLPSPRGEKPAAAADIAEAARQRAQQLQQERLALQKQAEDQRAAEAEAARRAAEHAYQQRQAAAAAAAAEVARMRADDQQQVAQAAAARAEAERRKNDARQQEQQRQQQQAQVRQQAAESEAAARRAAEEAKAKARAEVAVQRQAEDAARAKARAAAEAQKRAAAAEAREREREQMHQAMQQQRQEFMDRQRAAAANRRRAEDELGAGLQVPAAAAAGEVAVHVAPARQRRQRPAWDSGIGDGSAAAAAADGSGADGDWPIPPQLPGRRVSRPASAEQQQQLVGGRQAADAGDELSAEQRRQVWEDMRAAAQRNKQQLLAAQGPGLAAFLGAEDNQQQGAQQQLGHPQQPQQQRHQQQHQQGRILQPADQQPQQQYSRQPSRGRIAEDPRRDYADAAGLSPLERRRARLQAEQAARDAQLRDWQRQHWQEVKAAAARNRQQVMGELGIGKQQQQQQPPAAAGGLELPPQQPDGKQQAALPGATAAAAAAPAPAPAGNDANEQAAAEEEADEEFAAMMADMQDLVLHAEQHGAAGGGAGRGAGGGSGSLSRETSEDYGDEDAGSTQAMVVAGRFLMDGQQVALPVGDSDSLAAKVEALRMVLEEALGTAPFLSVYHRLESLGPDDDEEQVSSEFLALLGADKLRYLQLVHQLIVAEERIHVEQMV